MNGTLLLLRKFWPYIVALLVGMSIGAKGAWTVQGIRLTRAQQEFTQYKQDQKDLTQKVKEEADQQREKASKDYAHLSGILDEQITRGAVYRRCVATGKCGVRDTTTANTCIHIPAASGVDVSWANAVSTGPGAAATEGAGDQVVNDCAITTLRLNQLQADIEKQPGYGDDR